MNNAIYNYNNAFEQPCEDGEPNCLSCGCDMRWCFQGYYECEECERTFCTDTDYDLDEEEYEF